MPDRPWRRRRQRPRPPGRRWSRGLRSGGRLARRVLVVRRRRGASFGTVPVASTPFWPDDMAPVGVRRVRAVTAPAGPATETPAAVPLLTGDRTGRRQRCFVLVNACTVSSLLLGMGAIFAGMHGSVRLAAAMLLACVVFDGLDGALARRLGVSTPFGAQMDSLADMCSFGIATPVVAFAWLSGGTPVALVAPACALVAVCAAIRLARFNVSPKNGHYFSGVPTTIAAAIIVVTALLRPEPGQGLLAVAMVALLALAMVSSFPYFKLVQLRRVPKWVWPLGVVAGIADAPTTLGILVGAYLLSGPLLWARQRRGVTAV